VASASVLATAAPIRRETEAAPSGLESRCRSFMVCGLLKNGADPIGRPVTSWYFATIQKRMG
jgi:hypothetical protein